MVFIFQEVFPVRALSFHPGGEFLLVCTDHPTIRLYNVETAQCFVCSAPGDQHKDVVMDVSTVFLYLSVLLRVFGVSSSC